jgi:hypothetical protein
MEVYDHKPEIGEEFVFYSGSGTSLFLLGWSGMGKRLGAIGEIS